MRAPTAFATTALALVVALVGAVFAPANAVGANEEPNRYLVTAAAGDSADLVADLAHAGAEVVDQLSEVGVTVADLDAATAAAIDRDPRFVVEADTTVAIAELSWGLDVLDSANGGLDGRFETVGTGEGVDVFVLDTGVRGDHEQFAGRVGVGLDLVDGSEAAASRDCHGHGTHVASVAVGADTGVAPGATLRPVRVLGCDGSGSVSTIVAGIDWVLGQYRGPSVVNLSIGGSPSAALDAAVQRLLDAGIVVVVAAGNESADACATSPASVAGAITVGGVDRQGRLASFSNTGPCVDLAAPAVSILGASHRGIDGLRSLSGTSQAAPFVAGLAALVMSQHPEWTTAQVAAELIAGGRPGNGVWPSSTTPLVAAVPAASRASLVPLDIRVLATDALGGPLVVMYTATTTVPVSISFGGDDRWTVHPNDRGVARIVLPADRAETRVYVDGRIAFSR
jgi:subtilisin family serine protease